MRILIGTPVYDEQVTVPYFTSVVGLIGQFREERPQITFDMELAKRVSIARSRDQCATKMLSNPAYTHLLFIDADMGFAPSTIRKMLDFDELVVGCVYPRRKLNHQKALAAAQRQTDTDVWRHSLQGYIPHQVWGRQGDFARAAFAGTGLMLIKREALERLREGHPELISAEGFHPFAETVRSGDGRFVGEDVAFCRRWTDIGGDIWVCISETVTHIGRERFVGNFLSSLGDQSSSKAEVEGVKPDE